VNLKFFFAGDFMAKDQQWVLGEYTVNLKTLTEVKEEQREAFVKQQGILALKNCYKSKGLDQS